MVKAKAPSSMVEAGSSPRNALGAGIEAVISVKMMMIQISTGMLRNIST